MITNDDIKKLSSVFATKADLDKKLDQKFDEKLQPIQEKIDFVEKRLTNKINDVEKKLSKKMDNVQKSLDTTIKYFDTVTTDHETRIKKVEKKLDAFPLIASS